MELVLANGNKKSAFMQLKRFQNVVVTTAETARAFDVILIRVLYEINLDRGIVAILMRVLASTNRSF